MATIDPTTRPALLFSSMWGSLTPLQKWGNRHTRYSPDNPRYGVRSIKQLRHNLFVAETSLGDDLNNGPSLLGQRRL